MLRKVITSGKELAYKLIFTPAPVSTSLDQDFHFVRALGSITDFLVVFLISLIAFSTAFSAQSNWINRIRIECPKEFEENNMYYPQQLKGLGANLEDDWRDLGYEVPPLSHK